MANGEEAIARALKAGDIRGARTEYDKYAKSMDDKGQTPRDPRDLGIPKYN
ncbi:MAG: hypothetical protein ACOH18_03290 [Candidatus Saccharimonadaceae bacterium]